jgi:P-type Cu+ transporter
VRRATGQEPQRLEFSIEGMTCASCAARIEKRLNGLDGVDATVNYATETASVSFDPSGVGAERLVEAVEQAGYRARLPAIAEEATTGDGEERDPTAPLRRRLVASALLSLPVLLISMIPALQFDNWQWLALLLATPVVLWGGWPFHRAAWANLRHGAATMDTLISLGTLAAWGWSVVALFVLDAADPSMRTGFDWVVEPGAAADHIYLEVAAVVTTFILAGRYFEAQAKRRAGAALRALVELGAKEASVLDEDGSERRVAISELAVGDRFAVRPGERIATDGVVEIGSSAVDASLLTGESVPVEVGPGDEVAGATINAGGRLVVRATRIGSDTALAQIGRLVTQAQSGKAPVQRLADRVSAVFVPIVIALTVGTLGFWLANGAGAAFAFTAAVAVLIIACPCALGLATPTALLVGTGRGAQLGILIKGPEILESTRRVDTVVLDKTGTVTRGEMSLVDVALADGERRADVLRLAGALEDGSEHPIARAIAAAARHELGRLPAPEGFASREGLGVEGVVEGHGVVVGRPALLADWGSP